MMPVASDPFVQEGDISIRRMLDDARDYLLLSKWLTDERVLEFYEGRDNPHDLKMVHEKYQPRARGEDHVVPCILSDQDRSIGYIQYYPLTSAEGEAYGVETIEGVYAIDLFIGEADLWNHGIGTRAVSALLRHLFGTLAAKRVVIDPQVSNLRAIRCYEKCGFRKIQILPRHELHEGEYRDCWLMVIDGK